MTKEWKPTVSPTLDAQEREAFYKVRDELWEEEANRRRYQQEAREAQERAYQERIRQEQQQRQAEEASRAWQKAWQDYQQQWQRESYRWYGQRSNSGTNGNNGEYRGGIKLTRTIVMDLIALCHPDKHGNSEKATRMTQWLLEVREKMDSR